MTEVPQSAYKAVMLQEQKGQRQQMTCNADTKIPEDHWLTEKQLWAISKWNQGDFDNRTNTKPESRTFSEQQKKKQWKMSNFGKPVWISSFSSDVCWWGQGDEKEDIGEISLFFINPGHQETTSQVQLLNRRKNRQKNETKIETCATWSFLRKPFWATGGGEAGHTGSPSCRR